MSTTPGNSQDTLPENLRSIHSIEPDSVSDEGFADSLEDIYGFMEVMFRNYRNLEEDGQQFVEAFSHYAGLTADCVKYVDALEEAAENDLDSDTMIVDHFVSELYDSAMRRHNQSHKTRRWYGIADASGELCLTEEVENDGVRGKTPANVSGMVDRVDEIAADYLDRFEDLPESYKRKFPDWDEMGHRTVDLDSQYTELDLSWK
ncbi:hypothetical protein [Candidatus Nanohalovita haloferacivicina]|uniref:hypothetical protein n=1 Tax=Candidatus Nanohalovita haloferacivicina TaxID=2978046 RepID=UPI00325F9AD8|nr:hypothetical protein HBNXNv_0939 [Candidatus Nanohalobia archaeon BNXNv]